MTEVPRYSASRLQTYSDCGHAYWLEKFHRASQRQAVWFVQGTAVHSAIEAYERSFRVLETGDVLDVFDSTWQTELNQGFEEQPEESMWMVGGRKKLSTDIESRYEMGTQQVLDYISHHPPGSNLAPAEMIPGEPALEVGFQLDFGDFLVIGYIDVVREDSSSGLWFPEDVKTGSKMPADPYQLGTYGLALAELTGDLVPWASYWDCRNNKRITKDLTPFTKEVVGDWYRQFHNGREAEVFLPNPGSACFTCTVKPSCLYGV